MGACASHSGKPGKPRRGWSKKRQLNAGAATFGGVDPDDVAAELAAEKANGNLRSALFVGKDLDDLARDLAAAKATGDNPMGASDSESTAAATASEPPSRGCSNNFTEFGNDDLPPLCGAPQADARALLRSIYAGQAYASAFLEEEAASMDAMQLRGRLLELPSPQRRPALRYVCVAAPELRAWYLDDNHLAQRGLDVVTQAMAEGRSPELLSLADNGIDDDAMVRLSNALTAQSGHEQGRTQLRVLCLSSNFVGDAGIASIAGALAGCSSLELLDLRHNQIGPDGARSFAFALVADACGIRRLRLAGNNIGDEGAKCLAQALKRCPRLEELSLERNNISDAGAKHLADALRPDVTLLLAGNALTQAGKAMIREAKRKISAQGAFCTVTV